MYLALWGLEFPFDGFLMAFSELYTVFVLACLTLASLLF